jgi:SAM-dependent methyltransferase
MRSTTDIKRLYNEQDFSTWAGSTGLNADEAAVSDRHLGPLPRDARILDLGTGGGRLAFAMQARGFSHITGIDVSERMIATARERARRLGSAIHFEVQDAAHLTLPDASFDVVVALQQVLSLIDSEEHRARALGHLHRVLKPGGLLLASALSWEGRPLIPWISAAIAPFKWLKGEGRFDRHYLPLLKLSGKPNWRFPFERQAYVYYFTRERFEAALTETGFDILTLDSSRMLRDGGGSFAHGGYLYAWARRK